jgi:cysteine-rich repeat protein
MFTVTYQNIIYTLCIVSYILFYVFTSEQSVHAQNTTAISTTTLTISICGDLLVNANEDCDIPTDTGEYSTTILGRQCNASCRWGPYCGDAILQTVYDEECDDGNNESNDFCSSTCKAEHADSGGGTTGGGGSSSSGGRDVELGETQVSIDGKAFPNTTVTILMDSISVGTVRTNSQGEFTFNTEADPGTTSFSFYAQDTSGTRSMTINTTFDVTQGAVTNINGILIPPTIRTTHTQINPGQIITLSGQTLPNVTVEVMVDTKARILTTTSDISGNWSIQFDTSTVSIAEHTIKARFVSQTGKLQSESIFGTALQLFVGVEGKATSNSDLNRDGKINLIDFSILIFWWGTTGGSSNPSADINTNGKVGLEDFSILLFNWTN